MPRILLLGTFLALGFVAFISEGSFARQPQVKTKPSHRLRCHKFTPTDSLVKLLRAHDKKTSTEIKPTVKKKFSRVKSTGHKLTKSKRLSSHKKKTSRKYAVGKNRCRAPKKPAYRKTRSSGKLVTSKRKAS